MLDGVAPRSVTRRAKKSADTRSACARLANLTSTRWLPALVPSRAVVSWLVWVSLGAGSAAPRPYEGPSAVESGEQREIIVGPRVEPVDTDQEIARRVVELRKLRFARTEADLDAPASGRGALVAAIVFATAGGIASIVAIAGVATCGSCDEPDLAVGGGWAATTFFLPTPFLFGAAAYRREAVRVHRRAVRRGPTRAVPRRGAIAPGIILASLGVAALGLSYPFWYAEGIGLRAGGAALAIGGSIWAARVIARRHAPPAARSVRIMPMLGPTTGLALGGAF
jgi:hypothetical protein